jgi:TatD DNase family protein
LKILDIHTHVLPEEPGSALVCIGCGPIPDAHAHFYSVGLHPWDVTGNDEESFRSIESLVANPRVLAVGECGFDTLKGPSHEIQEQAFILQVEISERYGKPMIIHVVRDFDSVIRLRKQLRPKQPWLVHGFRGGPVQMAQLHSNGILVSLGLKADPLTIKQVPQERLFLETDGNTLISQVIELAATVRNESISTIQNLIIRNNRNLLSL